jgi:hypothetical protein
VPSLLRVRIQPLNYNKLSVVKISFGFAANWAFFNSSCSRAANLSLDRPNVSSVCMPTTTKRSFDVVIKRHRSYVEVVI